MGEAPVERLSPKHPDWIWLQSPADQLMAERSVQFDPKVSSPIFGALLKSVFKALIVSYVTAWWHAFFWGGVVFFC